jgi:C1A family cysteine protease
MLGTRNSGLTQWLQILVSVSVLILLFAQPGGAQSGTDQAMPSSTTSVMSPEAAARLESLQQEMRDGDHTYSVGYNPALEYSPEQLCGLWEPEEGYEELPAAELEAPTATLPSYLDWRHSGGVTPIKNQGGCSSCWAFGTVGPLESQIKLRCGVETDIAEQYLVSCNLQGYSCNRGWFAHQYHLNTFGFSETEAGAVLESSFPYQAAEVPCPGSHSHPYKLSDWNFVGTENKSSWTNPTIQQIKQAIYTHGPIAATVCAGNKFTGYIGGVFNTDETSFCLQQSPPANVNHGVVLVGWNDDQGADKGYWILRNSWGVGWGESGYMNIRYGISKVGYAANYVVLNTSTCPGGPPPPPQASSAITLRSPNGGRTYAAGGKQNIRWTYTGNPGDWVKIWLLRGDKVVGRIASNVPIGANGSGTFVWKIPVNQASGYKYRVKIVSGTDKKRYDVSKRYFRIKR